MKFGKVIAALIGGWLLYIGVDSAHGRIAGKGAKYLPRPVQMLYMATGTLRALLLFKLAVITFILLARQLMTEKKCCKDKED